MGISRRAALKGLLIGGTAAVGVASAPATGGSTTLPVPPADAVGLLYDATLCIGCKACVTACQDANGLPRDTAGLGPHYNAPLDLNQRAKTVIKLYRDDAAGEAPVHPIVEGHERLADSFGSNRYGGRFRPS